MDVAEKPLPQPTLHQTAATPRRTAFFAWAVAGILGLLLYLALHHRAFPEAQVHIELTRTQAIDRAQQWLADHGYDVSAYRRSADFECLDSVSHFLERSAPPDKALRLMQNDIVTWYWFVRFVVPNQEEEFQVALWPDGRLACFDRFLPDAAPAEAATRDAALTCAQTFLVDTFKRPLDAYEFKSDAQVTKPNRVDRTFTWTRRDLNIAGAKYEIHVGVSGNTVFSYYEVLDIPDGSVRAGQHHAAYRKLLARIAGLCSSVLSMASVVVLVLAIRKSSARYKVALWLGAIVGLLNALFWLNSLPGIWLQYDTKMSVPNFFGGQMLDVASQFVMTPLIMLVTLVPADALARSTVYGHVHLSRALTRPFWHSRAVLTAAFVGVCLAFVHAGFVDAFYVIGKPFGVWCPLAQPYTDSLDTTMPWLSALISGFRPAVSEEILYRLFAVTLLLKITKRPWIAVTVPAMIWAFNHTLYPQEPMYIRGVELTIVGMLYGIVFLRYGVIATMISHYAFNALVSGGFLFGSGNLTFQLSGAIVVGLAALPVLPGLLRLLLGRPLLHVHQVNRLPYRKDRESAELPPPLPMSATSYPPFRLLSSRALALLAVLGAMGAAMLVFAPESAHFGSFARVKVSREQAIASARQFLNDKHVKTDNYRAVANSYHQLNTEEADYIWQKKGFDELERIFRERFASRVYWYVRFYRPLEAEEYSVEVAVDDPTRIYDYAHEQTDDAKGATLVTDAALAAAEQYVGEQGKLDLSHYKLIDSGSTERAHRRDHWFVWEDTTDRVGEATFRVSVKVEGDEAFGISRYLNVPDAWRRARSEERTADLIARVWSTILGLSLLIGLAALLFTLARRKMYVLAAPALLALIAPFASMLQTANGLPEFWLSYPTATEPGVYATSKLLERFIADPLGTYIAIFLMLAFSASFYRYAFPGRAPLLSWFGFNRANAGEKIDYRRAWGEGILVAIFICLFVIGLGRLPGPDALDPSNRAAYITVRDSAPSAMIDGAYTVAFPGVNKVLEAFSDGVGGIIVVGIFGALYAKYIRRWRRAALYFAVVLAVPLLNYVDNAHKAFGAIAILLLIVLVLLPFAIWFVRKVGRDNVALYACIFMVSTLLPSPEDVHRALTPFMKMDCAIRLCALAALFSLGLYLRFCGPARETLAESVPPTDAALTIAEDTPSQ